MEGLAARIYLFKTKGIKSKQEADSFKISATYA